MLDLMRKKAQSPYLQGTVLVIILVFVFWGVGNNQGSGPNSVATVNGVGISYQEYQKTYNQTLDDFRQQFGGTIPKGLLDSLGIKDQVVNRLIDRVLLQQEAAKIGVHVSDLEVREAIEKVSSFQVNGVFNVNTYKEILVASRMSVASFEAGIRSDLLTAKVLARLNDFGRISDHDLAARFGYDNAQTTLQYVAFAGTDFVDQVTVSEDDLVAFYEDRKEDYRAAQKRKIQYLPFLDAELVNAPPSEEAINAEYSNNPDRYGQPERRQARHILIKTTADDTPQVREEKLRQAEDILARIRQGEDFAGIAMLQSEDGSASKGGDLGFFSRGRMVKPFEDAVFAMQEGEVSDVVESQFGYHVIKLEKIEPMVSRSLDQVRGEIIARLVKESSSNQARTLANKAYEGIIMAGSLAKYAEQGDAAPVRETDYFEQQNPPAGVVADPAFLTAAFSLGKGELSSLVAVTGGYAILYIADIQEPAIPALADIRDRVEKDLRRVQAKKMAEARAGEMLAAVRDGKDFAEAAKEFKGEVKETIAYSRQQRYNAGVPVAVADQGLGLSAFHPYPEKQIVEEDTAYVVRFRDRTEMESSVFEQEKPQYEKRLLSESANALVASWLASLKKDAEIEINQTLL